jgi:threonine dehydrogenase-like Zn-dependent dehydrogenase
VTPSALTGTAPPPQTTSEASDWNTSSVTPRPGTLVRPARPSVDGHAVRDGAVRPREPDPCGPGPRTAADWILTSHPTLQSRCLTQEVCGIGGLGHLALQYAKIAGAAVAAIDVTDDKLELARELGADVVIDARKEDAGGVLRQHGGAHAAVALAVNEAAFEAVNSGLRRGGRPVMVALPAQGTIQVPIFDTVLRGTSVIGSIVGTRQDSAEVFQLHAAGLTRVIRETRPLAAVNESMDAVLRGEVKARIVFDLEAGG